MKAGFTSHLATFLTAAGSLLRGHRGVGANRDDRSAGDDDREIDDVVAAFRQLVTKVSRDSDELSELYREAERRAASSALLSKTVVESVTSGIVVVVGGLEVSLVNSSARRLLGLDKDVGLAGRKLGNLFQDGKELEDLIEEDMRLRRNSSRQVVSLRSLDGRARRFGVSTSCVETGAGAVDALIAVFTELDDNEMATDPNWSQKQAQIERQSYLRGVLDSYDLLSDVLVDFDKIEARSEAGTLTWGELVEFSRSVRRTCDTMMAFALSLSASEAITELADINSILESVMVRGPGAGAERVVLELTKGLPHVKTVKKILERGLDLLIAGCLNESARGIAINTGLSRNMGNGFIDIVVKELSPTRPILKVTGSLRELLKGRDMRREAGLLLLASLPAETHRIEAEKVDGFFHFSIRVKAPIDNKAGQDRSTGDTTKRIE